MTFGLYSTDELSSFTILGISTLINLHNPTHVIHMLLSAKYTVHPSDMSDKSEVSETDS